MAVDAGKVALNPRGAYSSTTTYERLDVVTYQSNTYVALQTTLGNLPTDTSSWMALVKVDNASMSVRGLVKVDGTSITADADGTIHGHAAAGVNSFNGRDGDVLPEYGDYDAEQISFDNTNSGLISNRVQGAINELISKQVLTSNFSFDPSKTYAVGEWLIYQGILYEVIAACTGVIPPNVTYYKVITLEEKTDWGKQNRKKVLYLTSDITTGYTPNAVLTDVISNVGTLSTNTMVEGLHNNSGVRYFTGFLYPGKTYGAILILENTGTGYICSINNGVMSYITLESRKGGSVATPDNVYSSVSNRVIHKTGNIVTIFFAGSIANGKSIAGANGLIGTLPAGFRPSANISLEIIGTYNGVYGVYDALLRTDGTITTATGANNFTGGMRVNTTIQY